MTNSTMAEAPTLLRSPYADIEAHAIYWIVATVIAVVVGLVRAIFVYRQHCLYERMLKARNQPDRVSIV